MVRALFLKINNAYFAADLFRVYSEVYAWFIWKILKKVRKPL